MRLCEEILTERKTDHEGLGREMFASNLLTITRRVSEVAPCEFVTSRRALEEEGC